MATSPLYQRRPFLNPPEAFPRYPNGLINPDAYLDYLVDDPDNVPVEIAENQRPFWLYQHFYFQRPFYDQREESKYMRDGVLKEFCNSPYNQLTMRSEEELKAHLRFEEHVHAPPPETMKNSLVDFKYLDMLGAAAIGRRVALLPEALQYLAPGASFPRWNLDYSPGGRAAFFDAKLIEALQALHSPLVTPQRVITGVIKRTSRLLNSELLNSEASKRIEQDPVYYPVRLRKLGFMYAMSAEMLQGISTIEKIEDRVTLEALQTEADEVELAA